MIDDKISIIGGCGRVGLPLSLLLATVGFQIEIIDSDLKAIDSLNNKKSPFQEPGLQQLIEAHLGKSVTIPKKLESIATSQIVFFVASSKNISESEYLSDHMKILNDYQTFLNSQQLIVIRNTLPLGGFREVERFLGHKLNSFNLCYCPERIAQGFALKELLQHPQLVSGNSSQAVTQAKCLFQKLNVKTIEANPEEVEWAKLMTNSWRYLEFSLANQFYQMIEGTGLEFQKILALVKDQYPRANSFKSAGLTAGPCLFKDNSILIQQLKDLFPMGAMASKIHSSMPDFIVDQLIQKMGPLEGRSIALLGLSYKANNDDVRNSLAVVIQKKLQDKGAKVLAYDPFLSKEECLDSVLARSNGAIVGTPHNEFKNLEFSIPFVNCWTLP